MSIEQALVAAGAECVAGDLLLRHKIVGHYRHGVFEPSLEGMVLFEEMQAGKQAEILQVVKEMSTDPEVKDIDIGDYTIGDLAPPRRGRKPKAATE